MILAEREFPVLAYLEEAEGEEEESTTTDEEENPRLGVTPRGRREDT